MAASLVKMGAADGEVNVGAFAFDIERVVERIGSMEAKVDTTAVIDEGTGRVSYGTSVNVDQEVGSWLVLPGGLLPVLFFKCWGEVDLNLQLYTLFRKI